MYDRKFTPWGAAVELQCGRTCSPKPFGPNSPMKWIPLSLAILSTAPAAQASDLIVQTGASIQAAIVAAVTGDRVLVSPGTYTEQLDFLGKSIQVIGVGGAIQTVLDGDGTGPVVRMNKGETATTVLKGFTITGGSGGSFGAGGVQCGSPTLEDCIVRGNSGKFGGGISGSPVMSRCSILQNTASLTHGGGIYGGPKMSQCLIAGNHATSADGGGLYVPSGMHASLDRCIVVENSAVFANSSGGGLYVSGNASATLTRTLIAGNFATGGVFAGYGGGLVASANTSVDHCTVVGNSVSGSSTHGAGIFGSGSVHDSIVWGNLGGPQITNSTDVTFTDVEGGYPGIGNLDIDPLFIDGAAGEFHLQATSPVIDQGDPLALDPDGSPADMGAFSFQSLMRDANTNASAWNTPSWDDVSTQTGGHQLLRVETGAAFATKVYLALGTATGTLPGIAAGGSNLPLNPDAYFYFTLGHPNTALLAPALGVLDGMGRASVAFTIGSSSQSGLISTDLHHAVLVLDPVLASVLATTNAVRVGLVY